MPESENTKKMITLTERLSKLANLQYFDYKAFKEDNIVSKEVCGFILSLALIYNDIKNTSLLNEVIRGYKPGDEFKESKEWGEYNGVIEFIDRITIGILHELFNLIKNHKNVLEDKFFKDVIRSINRDVKILWQALVDTSLEQISTNKLAKDLMIIRNKVSFHYDTKAVFAGYINFFEKIKTMEKAYISRGKNMPESRFYFADAAAEGCMQNIYGAKDMDEFLRSVGENLQKLNHAMAYIINTFISKRGYTFREVILR